jgi:hypothetical protein
MIQYQQKRYIEHKLPKYRKQERLLPHSETFKEKYIAKA